MLLRRRRRRRDVTPSAASDKRKRVSAKRNKARLSRITSCTKGKGPPALRHDADVPHSRSLDSGGNDPAEEEHGGGDVWPSVVLLHPQLEPCIVHEPRIARGVPRATPPVFRLSRAGFRLSVPSGRVLVSLGRTRAHL